MVCDVVVSRPAWGLLARQSLILTSPPFFQNGRKIWSLEMCFEMCFGPLGAVAKTRLESRKIINTPHCICRLMTAFAALAEFSPDVRHLTAVLPNLSHHICFIKRFV